MIWNGKVRPHASSPSIEHQLPGHMQHFQEIVSRENMQILSIGVVKSYKSHHRQWQEGKIGVLMLCKDYPNKTYHLKFIDFDDMNQFSEFSEECYCEQELNDYSNFIQYSSGKEKAMIGYEFADSPDFFQFKLQCVQKFWCGAEIWLFLRFL